MTERIIHCQLLPVTASNERIFHCQLHSQAVTTSGDTLPHTFHRCMAWL